MRRINNGVCILIVMVLMFNMTGVRVRAEESESAETKVYSEATLDDEFADNRVIIVLKNEASLATDKFENSAFAGINCEKITNLSQAKEQMVQEKLDKISLELEKVAAKTRMTDIVTRANVMEIAAKDEELSGYNQILCIDLEETGKDKVLDAIEILEQREDVLYAGPDYKMTICSTTANDTYYSEQWAINMIKLPQAWDITTGSSAVKVAIIDTGIDGDHPDLAGRIDTDLCRVFIDGAALEIGEPIDNFYKDNSYGHGTFVAGIIGAVGNNGQGITGTCWNVKLVSLKVFNADGVGLSSNVIAAIDFAESQNIPIINFSASWSGDNLQKYYDVAMDSAIRNYSGLFVCSAGNQGENNDTYETYPANYTLPNMIVVGASTINDEIADFSNYGKNNVDIFAPGHHIYSTTSTGEYRWDEGTSFAAPYVAGVAALLLSKDSGLTVEELKQTILDNVDIVYGAGGNNIYADHCTSGGRLNAYKALTNIAHIKHTYTYKNLGVSVGHTCTCAECGYSYTESHKWFAVLSMNQCSKCGVKASIVPSTPVD